MEDGQEEMDSRSIFEKVLQICSRQDLLLLELNINQSNIYGFIFFVACSMALNSSTVLFIGLSNASDPELSPTSSNFFGFNVNQWSFVKNDITATYNFDDNTWTQHESLNYPSYVTIQGVAIGLRYGYEVLCSSYHDKHDSKILTISYMVDHYEHFARKYHPFAWISSIHSISWLPLEIQRDNFDIPGVYQIPKSKDTRISIQTCLVSGTLVTLKGMLYVLAYPNSKWDYGLKPILGYKLNVTNSSLSSTIMFEGGVQPCGMIGHNCPGQINTDILGFGDNFVAANMIME